MHAKSQICWRFSVQLLYALISVSRLIQNRVVYIKNTIDLFLFRKLAGPFFSLGNHVAVHIAVRENAVHGLAESFDIIGCDVDRVWTSSFFKTRAGACYDRNTAVEGF